VPKKARPKAKRTEPLYFVAGLGNPGLKYEDTRHNVGFLVLDELARRWGLAVVKSQFGALTGQGPIRDEKTVLLKPQQFMNRSGHPTRSIVSWFKSEAESLIVVHDDVDVAFGSIRVKQGGGHGGHNGLRDIDRHMESREYIRVRVGVSRPPEHWETADYVLGRWSPEQREGLEVAVGRAADAVEHILVQGVADAQNHFNEKERRPADASPPPGEALRPHVQKLFSPSPLGLGG